MSMKKTKREYKGFEIVTRDMEDSVPLYEIRQDGVLWDMYYSVDSCKRFIDRVTKHLVGLK
jgi:hypothetical protein